VCAMGSDTRQIALAVLNRFDARNGPLDAHLARAFEKNPGMPRRQRAQTTSMVYGVVRWRKRIDWVIASMSATPFSKIAPRICNILRLGVFQILFLTGVPHGAAVNTSVNLAKKAGPAWVAGYVNGLLRNVARRGESIAFPDPSQDPVRSLAVTLSYPEWLVERWVARMGWETARQVCEAGNRIPTLTVRANTLAVTRADLGRALGREAEKVIPTVYGPEGLRIFGPACTIPEMEAFRQGWFQVQDEAAQLVSHLLAPCPGDRVLEACAGRGGKTGHLGALMDNRGAIVALDRDPAKLGALQEEMARLCVRIVRTVVGDLTDGLPHGMEGTCDRVLVDAPCSGLGVLRRHPDGKWTKSEASILKCRDTQIRILESAAAAVKRGGILVYAVCSKEPEENEQVVERFLRTYPVFSLAPAERGFPDTAGCLVSPQGFLQTSPHRDDMDGFFAARLRRGA